MATKKDYKNELKRLKRRFEALKLSALTISAENMMLHKVNNALMQENRKLKMKSEIGIALLEENEREMIKQDAVVEHYESKFEYKGSK